MRGMESGKFPQVPNVKPGRVRVHPRRKESGNGIGFSCWAEIERAKFNTAVFPIGSLRLCIQSSPNRQKERRSGMSGAPGVFSTATQLLLHRTAELYCCALLLHDQIERLCRSCGSGTGGHGDLVRARDRARVRVAATAAAATARSQPQRGESQDDEEPQKTHATRRALGRTLSRASWDASRKQDA